MYKELVAYFCIHYDLQTGVLHFNTCYNCHRAVWKASTGWACIHCTDSSSDSLVSWKHNQSAYDKVVTDFLRSFVMPASTAAVERVVVWFFVQIGHARMPDKLLSELIFLKCNTIWNWRSMNNEQAAVSLNSEILKCDTFLLWMTRRSNTADKNAPSSTSSTCLLLIIDICSSLTVYYQVGDRTWTWRQRTWTWLCVSGLGLAYFR